ncbi:MAG: SDR family oxidoreductase [Deltaproteobacteria bacterium]|nr:SDR family oxidoreductase [Candidatus Zymogenaceae bacterium]
MEDFKDKVVIVTGGASGVGRELSKALAYGGAVVVVADINLEGANKTVSEIKAGGASATAAKLDVTKEADFKRLVEKTAREHKRLDMIFNNAGIIVVGDMRDVTIEHFRRIVDVNLWGAINGTMSAYPLMVKQGFGHIVNTASVAGLVPYPTGVPYSTTKHAIVGLSTSLRAEGKGLGVKVSVVCPGNIKSNIYKDGTILKAGWEDIMANLPVQMIETEKAIRKILAGVRKNKAIIVFPSDACLIWMLHRIKPGLLSPIHKKMVGSFRKLRGSK